MVAFSKLTRARNRALWFLSDSYAHEDSRCPVPRVLRQGAKFRMPTGVKVKGVGRTYRMAFDSEDFRPMAFRSSLNNEYVAVLRRVMKQPPRPDNDVITGYVDWVKRHFDSLFPGYQHIQPVSFADYLKNSNASPGVKQILSKTKVAMDEGGVGSSMVTHRLAYKWTTRKAFVKVENLLYRNKGGHIHKAPRLIQAAQPEFIVQTGPLTMAIQNFVKNVWSSKNDLFFSSGAHALTIGNFLAQGPDNILENDVSAFDSSIDERICRLESWMFKKFGANPLQMQLFDHNINTHGYTHGGIKYSVKGTRKSGDPWTSVFNSVLNGLMHLYTFERLTGWSYEKCRRSFKIVVQGDDSVCRYMGPRLNFRRPLLELGFDCECNHRSTLDEVEYCSNLMYKVERGYAMGPKPGRVLMKFGYFVDPPTDVHPLSLLRGVAMSNAHFATYVPMLRVLVDRILDLTVGYKEHFVKLYDWQIRSSDERPDIEYCSYLMYKRYYLSPMMVDDLETDLSKKKLGENYKNPYYRLLFDRDTDGNQEIFLYKNEDVLALSYHFVS